MSYFQTPFVFSVLLSIALVFTVSPLHAGFEEGLEAYSAGEYPKAFEEYRSAAETGDERAYGFLGGLYLYGRGIERDFQMAYVWFGMASLMGDKNAEKFQRTTASAMTLEQIGDAEKVLAKYKEQLIPINK